MESIGFLKVSCFHLAYISASVCLRLGTYQVALKALERFWGVICLAAKKSVHVWILNARCKFRVSLFLDFETHMQHQLMATGELTKQVSSNALDLVCKSHNLWSMIKIHYVHVHTFSARA